jgi:hypothetical protein
MKYNYYEAVEADLKDEMVNTYLPSYFDGDTLEEINATDPDDLADYVYDRAFTEDAITGNASGSYTFSSPIARGYVMDNIDIAQEACEDFGISATEVGEHFLEQDFEWFDVCIRCYVLNLVYRDVVESAFEEWKALKTEECNE